VADEAHKIKMKIGKMFKPDGARTGIKSSKGEKDLGVKLDHDLDFCEQIRSATAKANSLLSMLKNAFVS